MVRARGGLQVMTTGGILKAVWKHAPDAWTRILWASESKRKTMDESERDRFDRNLRDWLLTWRCATVASLALTFTASPAGTGLHCSGPILYASIGFLVAGCTLTLCILRPLREWLAWWRVASGGAAFIASPFLLPGIAYNLPFNVPFI